MGTRSFVARRALQAAVSPPWMVTSLLLAQISRSRFLTLSLDSGLCTEERVLRCSLRPGNGEEATVLLGRRRGKEGRTWGPGRSWGGNSEEFEQVLYLDPYKHM